MNVLVTGGAGYIGSHAALRLLLRGHGVTIIDDLSRGHRAVADILRPLGDLHFIESDVGDVEFVTRLLRERRIELVMHFAGICYVGESVQMPLHYYRQNTAASLGLLEAMDAADVSRIVFSSTCATYGIPDAKHIPISENCPQQPMNPYGRAKLAIEHMLADLSVARAQRGKPFAWAALRYFNVAGSDAGGLLGEDHDPETHIVPICVDAALGRRDAVTIFGDDYPTADGTCIRDYVHVDDLVDAHLLVMEALRPGDQRACNVGIGKGYSVREVIDSVQRVTGAKLPATIGPRRVGDPPALYAEAAKIRRELRWSPRFESLDEIVASTVPWRKAHPRGYDA